MDKKEQAEAEKRVKDFLIDPLMKRGLMRPSGMTVATFDDMTADLAKRLAYMTNGGLAALEEIAAANASGPNADRFPIGNVILEQAAKIETPPDADSPFMKAVFGSDWGQVALRDGWAPELLRYVRKNRKRWPTEYALRDVITSGKDMHREFRRLAAREESGALTELEIAFLTNRRAVIERCERLRREGMK